MKFKMKQKDKIFYVLKGSLLLSVIVPALVFIVYSKMQDSIPVTKRQYIIAAVIGWIITLLIAAYSEFKSLKEFLYIIEITAEGIQVSHEIYDNINYVYSFDDYFFYMDRDRVTHKNVEVYNHVHLFIQSRHQDEDRFSYTLTGLSDQKIDEFNNLIMNHDSLLKF